MTAATPDLSLARVPGILQQPIKSGKIGPAQISGVCLASVVVTNYTHRYALVTDGTNDLTSAACGPLRLLVPPHKVDTLLLPVSLVPNDTVALGLAGALIPYLTTGGVQLFSGREDSYGPTVQCFNASRDIPSGEPVKVQWITGVGLLLPDLRPSDDRGQADKQHHQGQ